MKKFKEERRQTIAASIAKQREDDPIMLLPELANYLRMKPITIYKWVAAGKIPGIKMGSQWRFRKSTIDAWMEANTNGKH